MGINTSYICAAQDLIRELAPYLEDCYQVREFGSAVRWFNIEHEDCHIGMNHGISRITFIGKTFVIKIDRPDFTDSAEFGNCESEYEFYQYAKSCEREYLFAPIHKFFYHSHYYYIMPFIDRVNTGDDDVQAYLCDSDADFINDNLYDMHCGNYGFDDDTDYPVILDYACARGMSGEPST